MQGLRSSQLKRGEEAKMSFQRTQVADFTNITSEMNAKIRENF
jgi:hypothetical protein